MPAPPIDLQPCDPDDFPTFAGDGRSIVPDRYTCADYPVPLDYRDPDGEQITLEFVNPPADDPAAKQGTVFFTFGGPGAPGGAIVAEAGDSLLGPKVEARFDIVGFDPRGDRPLGAVAVLRRPPSTCPAPSVRTATARSSASSATPNTELVERLQARRAILDQVVSPTRD